ncbi:hypothetical protein [Gryllotalpicola protaetiae]|uniref:Ferredoxin-NADPH reductase n=1 Tax=Gryllotalpicola protaetiae TaxID=2419771 RepID=A0A387BE97_9MICO|nr:hypothetical protein [Gryllotalpicola protaetiae]AYG02295.1 hypothetical protein D7I44_01275 [Gryllotalpicola protaetiae]
MPALKLPTLSQPSFDLVFGYVYTGLAVNLCLAAANAPLAVGLLLVGNPLSAWPFFLLLSLTLAPSAAAAFAAFEAANAGGASPFAAFWRGWRRTAKPAFMVGAALGALVLLVGMDLATTAGTPAGALFAPVLLLAAALGVAVAVLVLTGLATTDVRLGALAKASVFIALRRAPLSLLSLAAVAGACVFVLAQPVLGALLGAAPLLFIVFSNARASLSLSEASAPAPASRPRD